MDASELKWQQRHKKRQDDAKYRREQSAEREKLRPLRNAVNLVLRRSGIPHSETHYSSRVRGWPISTSEGWETESMIWGDPHHIQVDITARQSSSDKYDKARENELFAKAKAALRLALPDYKIEEIKGKSRLLVYPQVVG